MSKLAPMDQHLTTLNGALARADERFAKLGCATNGRTRQISVHAPRTTLIDTDWDTIGAIVEEPIPSTVRKISNPACSTTTTGMAPLSVAAAVPNGGRGSVAEPRQQQDRKRSMPGSLPSFIAGLVAGIGITVGLSSVINGGYRLQQDKSLGNAVMSWHSALPQLQESERATRTAPMPGHPASTAPSVPASSPESVETQALNGSTSGGSLVQQGSSRKLNVPPDLPNSKPSASALKQARTAVSPSTRRVARVRRPKLMENDNPY